MSFNFIRIMFFQREKLKYSKLLPQILLKQDTRTHLSYSRNITKRNPLPSVPKHTFLRKKKKHKKDGRKLANKPAGFRRRKYKNE